MADSPQNLNSFYNELRSKGVKLNHQFQLSFSGINIGSVETALENVSMWCQGAAVPGREQNVAEISYLGYTFGVPSNAVMTNELSLTMNADQNLELRDAFLTWMGFISDPAIDNGSANGGVKSIPIASAHLDLYNDKMDTILHKFVLKGIFPTSIGDMEMTNADPEIATFDVAFRYQFWKTELTPNSFL